MSSAAPHLSLKGKTAVVTGSSRGIGAGIVFELASRGADVVITYTSCRSSPLVGELETRIQSLVHSPKTLSVQTDLRDVHAPSDIINGLLKWRGGKEAVKVDILVNNAGTELVKPLGEISCGIIINISSVGARAGFPALGLYCSSKAALEGLTRRWAAELGKNGTTVNAVNPGPVESEMLENIPKDIVDGQKKATPLENRVGTVEEVAAIVAWLAGQDSRWVTGQVISASGGWAMY